MRPHPRSLLSAVLATAFYAAAWAGAAPEVVDHNIALNAGDTVNITVTRADEAAPPAPVATDARTHETGTKAAHQLSSMGLLFFVFVLAIFLGFELISKVPSQLHTPLMSGSNAISGISVVGALLAVHSGNQVATLILGALAVALAMINVVGGYVVTDRMLGMFKHKQGGAQ